MPKDRQKLKFLLFEARLEQDMVDHERSCLAKAAHLSEDNWQIIDLTKQIPGVDVLNGVDAIFIGGTGDY